MPQDRNFFKDQAFKTVIPESYREQIKKFVGDDWMTKRWACLNVEGNSFVVDSDGIGLRIGNWDIAEGKFKNGKLILGVFASKSDKFSSIVGLEGGDQKVTKSSLKEVCKKLYSGEVRVKNCVDRNLDKIFVQKTKASAEEEKFNFG